MSALGNIIKLPIPPALTTEQAWNRYADLVAPAVDNPKMMLDKNYMSKVAIAWAAWRTLFLRDLLGEDVDV